MFLVGFFLVYGEGGILDDGGDMVVDRVDVVGRKVEYKLLIVFVFLLFPEFVLVAFFSLKNA